MPKPANRQTNSDDASSNKAVSDNEKKQGVQRIVRLRRDCRVGDRDGKQHDKIATVILEPGVDFNYVFSAVYNGHARDFEK